MAQREIVHLISDLSGRRAAETVTFSLDGQDFEIDLTKSEAAQLRRALAPFLPPSRRRSGRRIRSQRRPADTTKGFRDSVRTWATAKGYPVPSRGRLPAALIDAYRAAH